MSRRVASDPVASEGGFQGLLDLALGLLHPERGVLDPDDELVLVGSAFLLDRVGLQAHGLDGRADLGNGDRLVELKEDLGSTGEIDAPLRSDDEEQQQRGAITTPLKTAKNARLPTKSMFRLSGSNCMAAS